MSDELVFKEINRQACRGNIPCKTIPNGGATSCEAVQVLTDSCLHLYVFQPYRVSTCLHTRIVNRIVQPYCQHRQQH